MALPGMEPAALSHSRWWQPAHFARGGGRAASVERTPPNASGPLDGGPSWRLGLGDTSLRKRHPRRESESASQFVAEMSRGLARRRGLTATEAPWMPPLRPLRNVASSPGIAGTCRRCWFQAKAEAPPGHLGHVDDPDSAGAYVVAGSPVRTGEALNPRTMR